MLDGPSLGLHDPLGSAIWRFSGFLPRSLPVLFVAPLWFDFRVLMGLQVAFLRSQP